MERLDRLNECLQAHDCVISINIRFDDFKYDLALTLCANIADVEGVTILFQDVSSLNLSGFGGGLTQFMSLEVTRINEGLDRIRYELREVEHETISFRFFTFSEANFEGAIL